MPADKIVRYNADQLDRLILLHRRKIQLAEKRLLHLGVKPAVIDQAATQADQTTPMADGGTIDLDGNGDCYLADHDDNTVTLRRVH